MTDFPASILQIATTAVKEISSRMEASPTLGAAATEIIARALMEEREAAASVLERKADQMRGSATADIMARIFLDEARAIRSGEQP